MASNYPPGVLGTEPEIVGETEVPEQFLVILENDFPDDGSYMEVMDESRLATHIDGADYLPVAVKSIFVLRNGALVPCHFTDVERLPQYPDPENESSTIYAYSPLYAGDERVASIPLTDH